MKRIIIPCILSISTLFGADESDYVTVKTHNQTRLFPREIACLSYYMRNICNPNPFGQRDVIDLHCDALPLHDTFDLDLILSLLMQAQTTLHPCPHSFEGSYVQLAQREPLASLRDHKKLLRLFIACSFLDIDFKTTSYNPHESLPEAIARIKYEQSLCEKIDSQSLLKAIAYNIAQKNPSFLFYFKTARYLNYNIDQLWSHVNAQRFLTNQEVPNSPDFNINFRDILVHDALNKKLQGNNAYRSLVLIDHHLTSLEGIQNVPEIKNIKTLNLSFNKLSLFPDNIDLPQLENLYLDHNELTDMPHNLPQTLRVLTIQWNRLKTLPKNLRLPRLQKLCLAKNDPDLLVPESIRKPGLAISTIAIQIFL